MSPSSSVSKPICFTWVIKEVQTENKNIHVHCKWEKKAIILTRKKKENNYFTLVLSEVKELSKNSYCYRVHMHVYQPF